MSSFLNCDVCQCAFHENQNDCCIRSLHYFPDRYFGKTNGTCDCNSTKSRQAALDGPRRQKSCPHKMASATLPDFLDFRNTSDLTAKMVVSRMGIPQRAMFGPLIAPVIPKAENARSYARYVKCSITNNRGNFNKKLFEYLIDSDDHCNWMKAVRRAETADEVNLIAFQWKEDVYFVAIKAIEIGAELKVCLAENYRTLWKIGLPDRSQFLENNAFVSATALQSDDVRPTRATVPGSQKRKRGRPRKDEVAPESEETSVSPSRRKQPNPKHVSENGLPTQSTSADGGDSTAPSPMSPEIFPNNGGPSSPGFLDADSPFPSGSEDLFKPTVSVTKKKKPLRKKCPKKKLKNYVYSGSGSERDNSNVSSEDEWMPEDEQILPPSMAVSKAMVESLVRSTTTQLQPHQSSANFKKKCVYCPLTFTDRKELSDHAKSAHGAKLSWTCPHCQQAFISYELVASHVDLAHEMEKICGLCEFTSESWSEYMEHLAKHNQGVSTGDSFQFQLTRDESGDRETTGRSSSVNSNAKTVYENGIGYVPPKVIGVKSAPVARGSVKMQLVKVDNYPYQYKRDRKKEAEKKVERCLMCNQAFCNVSSLTRHITRKHPDDQELPFSCPDCFKRFKSEASLKSHCTRTHRPKDDLDADIPLQPKRDYQFFDCLFCPEKFRQMNTYKEHVLIHEVDGMYRCPQCNQTCPSVEKARKHFRKVHADAIYACQTCGNKFKTKIDRARHMQSHSEADIQCPQCPIKFKRVYTLNHHLQTVHARDTEVADAKKTKSRPRKGRPADFDNAFYKCRLCKLGFSLRKTLVAHVDVKHPLVTRYNFPELNLPIRKTTGFRCVQCKVKYMSSEQEAKNHLNSNHPGWNKKAGGSKQKEDPFDACMKPYETEIHYCELCNEEFKRGALLLEHAKKEHPEYWLVLMPQLTFTS